MIFKSMHCLHLQQSNVDSSMYGGLGNSNENIKMFLQPFHRNY
jgi:hypothetical protein